MAATTARPQPAVITAGSPLRPPDPMKSTWLTQDPSTWNVYQRSLDWLGAHAAQPGRSVPKHPKTHKVPHLGQATQHLWILAHGFFPLLLHQLFVTLTARPVGAPASFFLYTLSFNFTVVRLVNTLRRLAHTHGFLDGDVADRNGIPDRGADKVLNALFKAVGGRMGFVICIAYDPRQAPLQALGGWRALALAALKTGLHGIILDFWFYLYHRALHELPSLWRFHRTHHLVKHPSAALTAYADHGQEFLDMVGVPLLTWATFYAVGLPLGFYDLWLCLQYLVYTEVLGHSGLRLHLSAPSMLSWPLWALGMELCIEDHDLHHRQGWRRSQNYGKQTRVWDRIFGTCGERVELREKNIDYVNQASMPIW
ncbi:uncharacterized protein UV8b_03453 [Ustilaginoidea virens]|uniref:Fatty acid hydroxylase domain-containing protein n=1 Tax=Ustilaginoidea virens TaxID=1159556 RepID=A0A063C7K3_USTVR|nr:uncharacterized protein UV8b_03453 [Ustilaginoidea virens]QUC19212.1 hypothetical protein UV8b_03453 [Ustilaginoidea virens]GAO13078.1 hypothetical protein UVI_02024400 [Ustilaginoidea virens]